MTGRDHPAVSASYETLTVLPSGYTRPETRQSRPEGPERREPTAAGSVGARTGNGVLAIVFGPVVSGIGIRADSEAEGRTWPPTRLQDFPFTIRELFPLRREGDVASSQGDAGMNLDRHEGDVAKGQGDVGTSGEAREGDVRSIFRIGEGDVTSTFG